MLNHDDAMLTFVKLAKISQLRNQWGPRDKFLILAAVAASQGGHTGIAARCRSLVLAHNPVHLVKRLATVEELQSDAEFQQYLKQLSKFCSYEKGEHLLSQLDPDALPAAPAAGMSPAEYAEWLLRDAAG
jgi:hypothetical protein